MSTVLFPGAKLPTGSRAGSLSMQDLRTPVLLWAGIGLAFLCLAFYVWGSWILSDVFRPVPVGPDPIPTNVLMVLRATEFIAFGIGMSMVFKFVILPLIREREIGFDGLLLINFLLIWWTDPIDNYFTYSFMYNGYAINMGGWANFIPGWGYPNHENLPEPLLMMCGFYLGFWILNVLFGCWALNALQRRWPRMSLAWRIAALFVALAVLDLVIENLIMRTGIAAYPGTVRSWTIFAGEVYQWPLYEAGIIAFVNLGFISLRYFKDDKGRTFVERGIERLQLSKGKKSLVTFLAIAGFVQPFFLFGYFVPYNLFAARSDTFPAYPSYMRNMICGEGTNLACPSYEWVPIPQRGAKWFVGPEDPRLPTSVRDAQGISKLAKDPYAWD